MAGYMTKFNNIYDSYEAAEDLTNGIFAILDADRKLKPSAANDTFEATVEGRTTLWGKYAVELKVIKESETELYFVESEMDVMDNEAYDEANYVTKAGKLAKAHMPVLGDWMTMSIDKAVYDTLIKGNTVNVAAGGTIVKKAT